MRKCAGCGGLGVEHSLRQIAPGFVQRMETICSRCGGSGEVFSGTNSENIGDTPDNTY